MEYRIFIDEIEYTEYLPIPMQEQNTLDESLDQVNVSLVYTERAEVFKPFSRVRIEIEDETATRELKYFVSNDNIEEIVDAKKYTHKLLLIEQTKWTERFLLINRRITNPLVHQYEFVAENIEVEQMVEGLWGVVTRTETKTITTQNLYTVNQQFTIPSIWTCITNEYQDEAKMIIYRNNTKIAETTNQNQSFTFTETSACIYTVVITTKSGLWGVRKSSATFDINIVDENVKPKEDFTITEVVNKLLRVCETIRENDTPRFKFNDEQAERYSNEKAPELQFNGTLWECLLQVGNIIHSIPRLKENEIYFEELGREEKIDIKLEDYVANTKSLSIENFASSIDSTVENISNIDDNSQPVIEPFDNAYITPRAETSVAKLDENNIFIPTSQGINKILKLEVGYTKGRKDIEFGDITPFVYEKREYDALSSYKDILLSKKYAIYYTQGSRNIYGLNFKLPNAISTALEDYSIKCIMKKITGHDYTAGDSIMNLMFRVTYIPETQARLKQYKKNVEDAILENTLAYNQSANKVSSNAYGEAMKGAIAKLGNIEQTKTFIVKDLETLNKIKTGIKFDEEYYISIVNIEYYKDFAKVSVGLSKNYNAISDYVGIKNEIRYYEVTEKNISNAYIPYRDFIVIGETEIEIDEYGMITPKENKTLLNNYGLMTIAGDFDGSKFEYYKPPTFVVSGQYNNREQVGSEEILNLTKLSVGNSINFTFKYDDNYSAGKNVIASDINQIQYDTPYSDIYGDVEALRFRISYKAGIIFAGGENNYDFYKALGQRLPIKIEENFGETSIIDTGDNGIVVEKGSGETPIITYQLHYLTNKNYILGKALTQRSQLLREQTEIPKLYCLTERIEQNQNTIDIESAVEVGKLTTMRFGALIWVDEDFDNEEVTGQFKSWAICKGNEILVAENKEFTSSNEIHKYREHDGQQYRAELFLISLVHNLENL